MKILLGYSYHPGPYDRQRWVEEWLSRLRASGIQVDGFCLTPNPPGHRLAWPELDRRWKAGEKTLLAMYERLALRLRDYDVFINWNGINLHPDFVRTLSTFNVYGCFDDPESSEDLSKPVAWAYDLAMVGNIAEIETYHQWGIKEVCYWPLGFHVEDYNPLLTKEQILSGERDVDLTLLCERVLPWRKDRLDIFSGAFPNGAYYGKGWPKGFLPESQKVPLLQRTKLGPNFHNSTGPINFRTFVLPANGVMQICDNRSHLGKVFELNKEVVGFDTVEEAIDLCRYYLAHDSERRQIAAAGWERAIKDYNEVSVFKIAVDAVNKLMVPGFSKPAKEADLNLHHSTGCGTGAAWRQGYEEVVWTDEKVKAFWDFESRFPEKYFSYQVGASFIARLYPYFSHAKNALDYGSGPGLLIPHLLERNINVTALDFSPESVRAIKDKFSGKPCFQQAISPQELDSLDTRFDLVLAVEVIEHLNDQQLPQLLGNIRQRLSPNGVAVFSTPNQEDFKGSMICCPDCRRIFHSRQHMRTFARDSLVRLLEENSFEIIAVLETDFTSFMLRDKIIAAVEWFKSVLRRQPVKAQKSPHLVAIARIRQKS